MLVNSLEESGHQMLLELNHQRVTFAPRGSFVLFNFSRGGIGAEECANLLAVNDLKSYQGPFSRQ